MRFARTMTVLATNGKLRKGRFFKTAIPIQDETRLPTMAGDASRENRPIETVITEFVARRECPPVRLCIERKWGFEEIVALFHDCAPAVRARANDPFQLARAATNVFCGRWSSVPA